MSEIRTFNLPDLGEGLEEGDVIEWLVKPGDTVTLNQEIVTIETAKAAVDIPVPFAGVIVECAGETGDTLTVGKMLCTIDVGADAGSGGAAAPAAPAAAVEEVDYNTPGLGSGGSGSTGLDAEEEPPPLVGYGTKEDGGSRRRRGGAGVAAAAVAAAAVAAVPTVQWEGKPLATPPVRKLAKDQGIDLKFVAGTGPEGSITRADIHAFSEATSAAPAPTAASEAAAGLATAFGSVPAPAPSPAAAAKAAPAALAPVLVGSAGEKAVPGFRGRVPGEVEKVAGIRKRIISKMEESRRTIPHALCATDADLTDLWEIRKDLTADAQAQGFDVKITPYVLMMRATCLALRRFPTLNARYDEAAGEIRLLEHINLGLAVDTDRGLIVANIKDAHTKSTLQLAMEAKTLAEKCRNGTASPGELTGGTFTTDNYGFFGNDDGNPIINAPEVGILGVGTMREKPWVHEGEIKIRRVARFQLAFDHRVCDGGEAGRFVTYVAELCANPARILLHS
ncbi:MAG: 2-oxoisovalerate dehydrogenase E2 component (dihydrolipoyl transacylase) [Nitriliruptoraceae bacterium]|jgi:2-oxoisovalerate dehydrogenase E2 component (dihydrolipoyl transacylase)